MSMPSVIRVVGEGTFWTSGSTLVVKGIGLASVFFILSNLGVAEYGILEITLSIMTLLSIFMLPGLESVVIADMGVEKGRGEMGVARNILFAYIMIQFVCAAIAWSVVFFGAKFFASLYTVPWYYVHIVAFLFLLSPLRAAYTILFRVRLQFALLSLFSIVEEGLKLCLIIGVLFFTELGVYKVLFAIIASQLLTLILLAPFFVLNLRKLTGGSNASYHWSLLLLQHGKWSVFSTYMGNVGRSARLWIIQRLLGFEAVGLYSVAIGLLGHVLALAPIASVVSPLLPQFVNDHDRFNRLLNKSIQYQFIAWVIVGVGAILAFPLLIRYFFPFYAEAIPLFQVLLLTLIPGSYVTMLAPVFSALKLQRSFFLSMTLKTVMTIVFSYVGILFFGIWGLALEALLTACIQAFERVRSLTRQVPWITISPQSSWRFDDDDRLVLEKIRTVFARVVPFFPRL